MTPRTGRFLRKTERGSTMVEFGLVVMVLMTLMLAVVDFSRVLYTYHFVSSAARQAARWAAVNGSTCSADGSCNGQGYMNNGYATASEIQTFATNLVPMGVNAANVTATVSWPLSGTTPPSDSHCTADPTYPGCQCYTSTTVGSDDTDENSPGCPVQVIVSSKVNFIFPFVHVGAITLTSTSQSVIAH